MTCESCHDILVRIEEKEKTCQLYVKLLTEKDEKLRAVRDYANELKVAHEDGKQSVCSLLRCKLNIAENITEILEPK